MESARAKFQKAEDRAQKRDQLRSCARKMLKDKLKIMSRSEAISDIMPIAKRKQTSSAKGRGKGKAKKLSSMLKNQWRRRRSHQHSRRIRRKTKKNCSR